MSRGDAIRAAAVVIPVHDEEELLGACLSSVCAAARQARVAVEVVVVLDTCSDDSGAIAETFDVTVLHTAAHAVGAARHLGARAALARFDSARRERVWLAHTDGDSVVPEDWLTRQLDTAAHGADVVAGSVRPFARDLSPAQIDAWTATHEVRSSATDPIRVYGANLGIRASTYCAAGGFEPVAEHEDVGLVARARELGARVVRSDALPVQTSGRAYGRTPGGFARFLREDLLRSAG